MIRVHGLKACDTCRTALKDLRAAGQAAELRDLRAEPLSDAELSRFLGEFGYALVNRRSTTWRDLDDTERARPAADLLRDHPALMKRPVVETAAGLYLGWTESVRSSVR